MPTVAGSTPPASPHSPGGRDQSSGEPLPRQVAPAQPWRLAMARALYGADGFYHQPAGPAGHFRTSCASPLFARAVTRLLHRVDAALGHPETLDLVDVGAGRGELLDAVRQQVDARVRLVGVEVADRPAGLDPRISWTHELPEVTGLVLANEWLDNVPTDVVRLTGDGPRLLLVDGAGREQLGPPPDASALAWLARWWPLTQVGERAEVGRTRDLAWADAVSRVRRGLAVAVDYGHTRASRPAYGTLTGYRAGRQVSPIPDGSCDLTAHVALDSCLLRGGQLSDQRTVLRSLGVRGDRPPRELASADPTAYLRALRRAGEAAELTARRGLGDFGWLLQPVGIDLPSRGHVPATRA